MEAHDLVFLKLGGSLITDKDTPSSPRREVLARLATEIAEAHRQRPEMPLVLGHGSGSFGHTPARKYGTRQGVHNAREWLGFAEVWKEARALNQIVVEALLDAGLPVIAFPPSAAVTAHGGSGKPPTERSSATAEREGGGKPPFDPAEREGGGKPPFDPAEREGGGKPPFDPAGRGGQALRWDLSPLRAALNAGLVPLVNGDTIFDEQRGGTILSTEDLFLFLGRHLHPARILLAGRETGVWADYPARQRLVKEITPANFASVAAQIGGSASIDVTGGMIAKVRAMLDLVDELPGFEASIFSGLEPGWVRQALLGAAIGTRIHKE